MNLFFFLWRLKTRWNPKEKKKKTRNEGCDYLGWGFTEAADPTTAAPATWRWWTNEQKGPGAPKMRWISAGRNEVYGNVPPHRHASQSERTCRVGGPVSLSLSDEKKDLITFFSMKKKENTFDETSWLYGARYSQWRQENSPLLFLETVSRDLTQMKHEIEKKQQFRASHSN